MTRPDSHDAGPRDTRAPLNAIEVTLRIPVDQLVALAGLLRPAPGVAQASPEPAALTDKGSIARALGVSKAQVDRFVRAGMPHEQVGARRRFDLEKCRAWLAARGRRAAASDTADEGHVDVDAIARRAGLRVVGRGVR